MKKNELLTIVTQAFYGNRTVTTIKKENMDAFIQGYVDASCFDGKNVDRTIVKVPNTDELVFVYNKYKEAEAVQRKERILVERNHHIKPLAVIPEEGIEIYSRCIVCRMNDVGEFESLKKDDYPKFMDYLAE